MQPKGYWIAHLEVSDPERHRRYAMASSAAVAAFGGRFLVRGGSFEQVEGTARPRHVVIEFESYARARACYESDEYRTAKALREHTATADIAVVEGFLE